MINEKDIQKYICCEDISLIENYYDAVNSPEKYECHHRLETELGLSKQELIDTGRYFNVEAKYLMFMTAKEHKALHMRLHKKGCKRIPKQKCRWKTANGEIIEMSINHARRFHPDWILLNKN